MHTVLVVDDSAPLRAVICATLRMGGYQVLEASDGEAALALLDTGQRVDLIVSDINMPAMSGIAFTRSVQRRPKCHGVPVLMLTVESAAQHRKQAQAAGAAGFITKPVDSFQLLKTIGQLLQ